MPTTRGFSGFSTRVELDEKKAAKESEKEAEETPLPVLKPVKEEEN